MEYTVQQNESDTKGSYYIESEGQKIAEMTYSIAGTDRIIIDHTEVGEAYKGTGLGKIMVEKAVEDARAKQISIVPLCPFARSVFDKNPQLRDVL